MKLYWIAHNIVQRNGYTEILVDVQCKPFDISNYPETYHFVQGDEERDCIDIGRQQYTLTTSVPCDNLLQLKKNLLGKLSDCPTIDEIEKNIGLDLSWAKVLKDNAINSYIKPIDVEVHENICPTCGRSL